MFHQSLFQLSIRSVFGNQKWATKRDDGFTVDGDESDFETFLASSSAANAISRFRHDNIRFRRRQDLNIDARGSCGPVNSLSWQPLGRSSMDKDPLVIFSTIKDKELRLCRVSENGKKSHIEYSIKTPRGITPSVVKFMSESDVLITNHVPNGRVAIYNIEKETSNIFTTFGGHRIVNPLFIESTENILSIAFANTRVVNMDSRSKHFVSEVCLNNPCVGMGWSNSDGCLYLGDEKSNIYQFDPRMNKFSSRIQLDTTVAMSSFALNKDQLAACGSPFGTVDVIDVSTSSNAPVVSFDRMVTGIDNIAFHPIHKTMLVASSSEKKNALRVYECANGRTLQGWPTENEPIGRARDLAFSDCGRFFAVGCKSGRVQMYATVL